MLPAFLMILLIATVLGATLIYFGFRGRKINDHPVCAQCRFDLEGVYPECVTCPECGSGLKRERSVITGARKRMPAVAASGLILLISSLLPVGVAAYTALTGGDLNKIKPLGLILWEVRFSDAVRAEKLASEIMSRILAGALDAGQYQQVIRTTLDMQADRESRWSPAWGDFIERAKFDGVLTEDQEDQFLREAARFELVTRSVVRAGSKLPALIRVTDVRLGSSMNLPCPAELRAVRIGDFKLDVSHDGKPVDLGTFGLSGGTGRARRMMYDRNESGMLLEVPGDIAEGRYEIVADLVVAPGTNPPSRGFSVVIINGQVQRREASRPELAGSALVLRQSIDVIDALAPSTVRALNVSDDERAELVKQLRPTLLRRGALSGGGFADDGTFMIEFPTAGLSVPVSFEVVVRSPSGEGVLGNFVSGRRIDDQSEQMLAGMMSITMNGRVIGGTNPSAAVVTGRLAFNPGERVDIVLKPRGELVELTMDQERFADLELVFEDVPVEAPRPDPFEDMNRRMQEMLRGRFPR